MKKVTAILAGAGSRGKDAYGAYALQHPLEIQFVAVAEPDREKRDQFGKLHGIPEENRFASWEEMLEKPKMADAFVICTQDRMHYGPTAKGLEKGYHILLEKPMSVTPEECVKMGELSGKYNRIFMICHVLRYTAFFSRIKELLDSGAVGKIVSIQHNENVAYWHMAHSFVRGNWRNSDESSPMILAKSCHDMDILLWLAGADCVKVSSFGGLTHFREENAPAGSTERCTDGCAVEHKCPYSAMRQYLGENTGWPTRVISLDTSLAAREEALRTGPYGRCVYRCDNNVVDHQVVNMEFSNSVTAAFTMCAFTKDCSRTLKIMGTMGEIRASMEKNEIEVANFSTGDVSTIEVSTGSSGHGGGDAGLMRSFIQRINGQEKGEALTSANISVQSHIMSFAAEKSRLENKVIDIQGFMEEVRGR